MNIKAWISAFRLRTLPLSLSCIGMGAILASSVGKFDTVIFVLCIVTTVLLQLLSNLANDYGDTVNGADIADRKGPVRAVQSGAISMLAMKNAIWVLAFLSLASGCALLYATFGVDWRSMAIFLGIGLLCILAAITYTVGKKPYGYAGLGDLSVLLFFGFVGVIGSSYLFTKTIEWIFLLPSLSCGFLSVAVLNVNNIRDIESDKKAGKYSIPVRIGREKALIYHWVLISLALSSAVFYTSIAHQSNWQWLFLLSLPLFINNGMGISRNTEAAEIDPFLKQLAISTLVFVILFGTGILLVK